jgi:acetyl esterase/lipase
MKCLTALFLLSLAAPLTAAEMQVHRDLAYAEPKNERQTLDVYTASAEGKRPIVFWIHGGGWQKGDKTGVQLKPQAFVDRGLVFVSTNYRFWPNVTIDVIAQDLAKSMKWVHDHAADYGGDPNAMLVMGHSAGAQLAALLCTDEKYLKAEGLSLAIVKGCVPVDGDTFDVPMRVAATDARSGGKPSGSASHRDKFGTPEQQKNLSPVTHVAAGKKIPPFLVLHILADPFDTRTQAERFVGALREAGIQASAFAAEGKTHTTINADLGQPDDPATVALFEFVDHALDNEQQ